MWLGVSLIGVVFVLPVMTLIADIRNMIRSKETTAQVGLSA